MIMPPSTTNPLPVSHCVEPGLHGEYQLGRCAWLTMRTTERSIAGAAPRGAAAASQTDVATRTKKTVRLLKDRLLSGCMHVTIVHPRPERPDAIHSSPRPAFAGAIPEIGGAGSRRAPCRGYHLAAPRIARTLPCTI